ncbi:MAG: hypothetical protein HFJ42_03500 [Clostridia bacterium]|nr:hypothetical protein [Clostridia bacterium]
MKKFAKKGTVQKTIIAILMVLCINFIVPTYSHAGFIGGVLINPILDLVASIGDIVQSLLQWSMTGQMAAGESIFDSKILVDEGSNDNRIKESSENATISVSESDLELGWFTNSNTYQVPIIEYSPEEIFSNKVPYLDINFIKPTWTAADSAYGINGSAAILQNTVAGWYVALRNLAIVGLLCVLVYVGIRIMLCSTASDKAKYKTMLTDWLIALCIIFFLHYIMSFTLVMVNSVNKALTGSSQQSSSVVIGVDNGKKYETNIMGAARFMVQSKDTVQRCAYLIIYLFLIYYTCIFTWHYLKRVLMMAFLTIIAPLVALTYPLDKMKNGSAQAFNMWLKEYVYNALIQPFHLMLYMIFVGGVAMDLAKVNLIYAIAAIAFVSVAEKILRKLFGMEGGSLGTMGALAGFTTGALFSGGNSSSGAKGGNAGASNQEANKPPRYERHHGTSGIDYAENHNLDMGDSLDESGANEGEGNNTIGGVGAQLAENNLSDEENEEYNRLRGQLDNADNNDMYLNPDQYAQTQARYAELENRRLGNNQEAEQESGQQESGQGNIDNDIRQAGRIRTVLGAAGQGLRNVTNAHGGVRRMGVKALKGTARTMLAGAKLTGKVAGTMAGGMVGLASGLASGNGIGDVIARTRSGIREGRNVADSITGMPEKAYGAGKAVADKVGGVIGGVAEGTRNTIDTFRGNTNLQDRATARAFMKDQSTEQYVRDKWVADHNGQAASSAQLKEEMNRVRAYANEGMTDISAIYRARKAEEFGVEAPQAAKIALLAQDRNITSEVLGDEKKFNSRKADFTQEFMNKGMSETQAEKQADYVLNVMKAQVGQRHNLKRRGTSSGPSQPVQSNSSRARATARAQQSNANTVRESQTLQSAPQSSSGSRTDTSSGTRTRTSSGSRPQQTTQSNSDSGTRTSEQANNSRGRGASRQESRSTTRNNSRNQTGTSRNSTRTTRRPPVTPDNVSNPMPNNPSKPSNPTGNRQ